MWVMSSGIYFPGMVLNRFFAVVEHRFIYLYALYAPPFMTLAADFSAFGQLARG